MDFKDQIHQLADRIASMKEQIKTEEATKNAFIMPFIQMLGYDVFNPLEVVPEMDCDIAKKKGEKIDYAIMKDGEPIMLIECKHWEQNLDIHDNQLKRYYVASKAKFGVLTNGIKYRFYADLIKENIMDDVPFLEFDFENIREPQIEDVKKFHKSYFDLDNILSSASELKYMSEIKKQIRAEFADPSADLVKFFTKRVYDGVATQKVLDQFTDIVKRALNSHINDVMSEKLGIAIKATEDAGAPKAVAATPQPEAVEEKPAEEPEAKDSKIVTTDEEIEEAIRLVSADSVIAKLPEGINTNVGEGGDMLSTGEKQLISFARAILADPRILVLDEATSALDNITQKEVSQAIDALKCTRIIIAHRLSTIKHVDEIVVLESGGCFERQQ